MNRHAIVTSLILSVLYGPSAIADDACASRVIHDQKYSKTACAPCDKKRARSLIEGLSENYKDSYDNVTCFLPENSGAFSFSYQVVCTGTPKGCGKSVSGSASQESPSSSVLLGDVVKFDPASKEYAQYCGAVHGQGFGTDKEVLVCSDEGALDSDAGVDVSPAGCRKAGAPKSDARCFMERSKAVEYCKAQGGHFPSARELAQFAAEHGGSPIIEVSDYKTQTRYLPAYTSRDAKGEPVVGFYYPSIYGDALAVGDELGADSDWASAAFSHFGLYDIGNYGESGDVFFFSTQVRCVLPSTVKNETSEAVKHVTGFKAPQPLARGQASSVSLSTKKSSASPVPASTDRNEQKASGAAAE